MKLRKVALGLLAAITTFTLGMSAYTGVRFVFPFAPTLAAKSETSERIVLKAEPISVTPIPVEPAFVVPTANEEIAEEEDTQEFDPAGVYNLHSASVSNAFSDIGYLEIQTYDYGPDPCENYNATRIPPTGSIQSKKMLKFTHIAIGGKEIAFQTATINGVSYKFTGRFQSDDDGETDSGRPDLKGRLIKIKNDKWAAQTEAKFYVSEWVCGC